MELDKNIKSIITEDPQEGQKWKRNMCSKCVFNNDGYCSRYNKDRLEVPVDIFDCPAFEPIKGMKNEEASNLLNVEVKE